MKQSVKHLRFTIILAAIIVFFSYSQVTNAQQQKRDVSGFDKISYSISGELEITQGNKEELILIGDSEDLEKIITVVDGGKLKIYTKNNNSRLGNVIVKVTVKELSGLSIAGSGNVEFKSDLKTGDFDLDLSGSANIVCPNIAANELDIDLAGSGNIRIGGELESELEISIAGSGNVDCADLKAKEVEVKIAGSGDVKVWATDELESNIVGSGNVYYKGRPLVDAETSGSGKTKPL
jgi:hypothetical protein